MQPHPTAINVFRQQDVPKVTARPPRKPRRRSGKDVTFPTQAHRDFLEYAAKHGADASQLDIARELYKQGYTQKAKRVAWCGLFGRPTICTKGHSFYRRYRCERRCCPTCARIDFRRRIKKYKPELEDASELIERECHKHGVRCVSASIEFVAPAGVESSPEELKRLAENVKRFECAVQRQAGVGAESSGLIFTTGVTAGMVHAGGFYTGPSLPEEDLRRLWEKIAGQGARITIRPADSIKSGLRDVLEPSIGTPAEMAKLEAASDGVRRVHTLGGFYNVQERPAKEPDVCPICGAELLKTYTYLLISQLEADGVEELSKARAEARAGPSGGGAISAAVP